MKTCLVSVAWLNLSGGGRSRNEIGCVSARVVEGDLTPGIERCAQRLAVSCRVGEDLRTLVPDVAPLVAGEHHRFERNAIRDRPRRDSHRMTDGAAAELQHHVLAQI